MLQPVDDGMLQSQIGNEENTKKNLITPLLQTRWPGENSIIMEYPASDGRITVDEYGMAHRGRARKIDYLLLHNTNLPLALVEAKGRDHAASEGYQQAIDYAKRLDVPFAYATNGDDLIEHDMLSGLNREMKLADFPTRDELWNRYVRQKGMSKKQANDYSYPYYQTATGKTPRYYQRIIVNKAMEAIQRGQRKLLIVSATGTGKTFEAFQIIWRFWKTGIAKRTLFLADRSILVDQTMREDFAPFGEHMVKFDNSRIDTAHEIYLGIYQQFVTTKDGEVRKHYKQFPRDFFDLVVVDECHRSSADQDSSWHEILDYFDSAIKIGMTATPKEDSDPTKSNIAYFGDPIYTYSLKQGIEDGYLAPYKVVVPELDIDRDGYTPSKETTDVDGNPIEIKLYEQKDFDRQIIVQDRRELVAKRIAEYMRVNDMRFGKTIVFCESIEHAHAMQRLLENENADLVAEDYRYCMSITADDDEGKAQLDNFITNKMKYPVIAVTSKLMSTGVNAKTCELIVLDRSIGSMTEFKQIIGRGTRVVEHYKVGGEEKSKMYFTILDFRANYRKFNDPSFDGDPVDVMNVPEGKPMPKPPIKPSNPPETGHIPEPNRRMAKVAGVEVSIVGEAVKYMDTDGHLVEQNLTSCIRNNIVSQYETYDAFQAAWELNKHKSQMASDLLLGDDWGTNFKTRYGYDVDPFDIICCFAYQMDPPMSREHRARRASMQRFIDHEWHTDDQRTLLHLLLDAYVVSGFESLRNLDTLDLPQFRAAGFKKLKAVKAFGGKRGYYDMLDAVENALYLKD
ncbi:restriction endonuclease [Bifidobacterium lemurum]|uniref:Restriction endonuclease n=1 Tax=Bifidobacterium lemurum TaxID=1603886 RepID=A0A261FX26_9BIFI|nr:type I restriction endonuclease subunit R [Bifidobacterium lemurum]OZG63525.1 restriction endonuclease [Bifidobacterium lemurum]QOL34429.1 DEAD/DEAH box helicase family protein [Bifidobacterium lemurum]